MAFPAVAVAAVALVVALLWPAIERLGASDLPPRAAPSTLRWRWGAPVLVALVVSAVCWPALRGDFLGDDFGYVRLFHDLPLFEALRPGDISHGIWGKPLDELRPVFAASFELGLLLHGPSASGFHATSLLLHVANSLLLYALALRLAGSRLTALAAGLLFGLMPVHHEPVSWITGKVDSLPTFFYLATFLLFVRFRTSGSRPALALAWAVYAVGVFSKEILVTLPLMVLAWDALWAMSPAPSPTPNGGARLPWPGAPEWLRTHAPFWLVAAGFLVARRLVFESFAREGRLTGGAMRSFMAGQAERLGAVVAPFDGRVSLALVFGCVLGCAIWLWPRRDSYAPALRLAGFFGVAWWAVTMLPLAVTYVSDRHLYLPSCGAALGLAALLFPAAADGSTRSSAARWACLLVLWAAYAGALRERIAPYLDAGRFSRLARAGVEAAAPSIPNGAALVLSGFPDVTAERMVVWRFALPFALQPPFVARDLYTPYNVFEPPVLYCRPASFWWRDKQPLFAALANGDPRDLVELYSLHWNERRESLVARRSRHPRARLAQEMGRVLGAAPQDVSAVDLALGQRLVGALSDLARSGSEPIDHALD